ncbi:MAG: MFS transporter, partial [Desulfobacteraceae bacterium 4572_88]
VTAGIVAGILKDGSADAARDETFDRRGAVLLAGCFGPMLFAITHWHKWGYTSPLILFCVCLSLVSAVGLIWFESRICYPIFEPSLLRIRLFILPALATIFLFLSLFSMIFLIPFYLIHPCRFSVNQVGYIMVTPFAFLFVFSPISGMISDRIGSQILCTLGMGIVFAGLFALSRLSPTHTAFPIVWRLALVGIGTAIFISPNNAIVMSAVPPEHMGVASGTLATARNLGMVLGIALAGTLFNMAFHSFSGGLSLKIYGPELEGAFMDAFRYAMFSGAVMAGMGAITAFLRGKEKIKK